MGEMIWLTALVGMVGATARALYRHPIQWSDDAAGGAADKESCIGNKLQPAGLMGDGAAGRS